MEEKYYKLHSFGEDLYTKGSPVIIKSGEILLDTESGKSYASFNIQNIDRRVLTFLTVSVNESSSFGKSIGGEDAEHTGNLYTYRNLEVVQNGSFGEEILIPLKDSSIRDYIIILKEAVFSDGSRVAVDEELYSLPTPTPLAAVIHSKEARLAYCEKFGEKAILKAERISDLWRCSCGCINKDTEPTCISCKSSLSEMLSVDQAELEQEYLQNGASKRKSHGKSKKKNKKDDTRTLIYVGAMVALICSVLLIGFFNEVLIPNNEKKEPGILPENTDYTEAESLIESGKYTEAVEILKEFYYSEDSRELLNEAYAGMLGISPSELVSVSKDEVSELDLSLDKDGCAVRCADDILEGELVIPHVIEGMLVVRIDDKAFSNTLVTSVVIPISVTSIGISAFDNCIDLESVTIPESVTDIGDSAFRDCISLTSILLPEGVTSIGRSAFWKCTALANVTIPNSIIRIDSFAFSNCKNLKTISYNGSEEDWNIIKKGAEWDLNIADYKIKFSENSNEDDPSDPVTPPIPNVPPVLEALSYTLSSDGSSYIVTGIGDVLSSDIVIPANYQDKPVTGIGYQAFYGCSNLKSVTIPDSITNIGTFAFLSCISLATINYLGSEEEWNTVEKGTDWNKNTGNYTINFSEELEYYFVSATESYTVERIGTITATDIVIPDTYKGYPVTMIASNAFENNTDITSLTVGKNVTSISMMAFYGCTSLEKVVIPESVSFIETNAFRNCTNMKEVHVENLSSWCNISFGGYSANPLSQSKALFLDGIKLTNLIIPSDVTKIGAYAFYGCTSIENIKLSSSVERIDAYAFQNCTNLTEINFLGTEDEWNLVEKGTSWNTATGAYTVNFSETLSYSLSSDGNSYSVTGIGTLTDTDIVIPSTYKNKPVTEIDIEAFANCAELTSITIPDSITSIGDYAFRNCTELKTVNFGENSKLESIGSLVFLECTSLESITIPDSVTSIGCDTFSCCTSLESVTFEDASNWYVTNDYDDYINRTGGTQLSLDDTVTNAEYFKNTYMNYYWYKKQ